MRSPTIAVSIAFPLLSCLAIYGMTFTAMENGLLDHLGVETLFSLRAYVEFFTPILDPQNISLSIQGLHFFASWMSAWVVIMAEWARTGASLPVGVVTASFGVLMELMGVAVIIPWWCLMNILYHHSDVKVSSPALVSVVDAQLLPWSLAIGAGLPAALMQLCPSNHPAVLFQKSTWIIARLFHPIFTLVVFQSLRRLQPTETKRRLQTLAQLHKDIGWVYKLAFCISAVPHVLTAVAISLPFFSGQLFSADTTIAFSPKSIWPVTSPWHRWSIKVESIEIGIGIFLSWNEIVTAMSVLLWGVIINRKVMIHGRSETMWYTLAKSTVLAVIAGPSAAMAMLALQKDVMVHKAMA